jgi:hypothetical protein
LPGVLKHLSVVVNADNLTASPCKFGRYPAGAASSVQHQSARQRIKKVSLAMNGVAFRFHLIPPNVVVGKVNPSSPAVPGVAEAAFGRQSIFNLAKSSTFASSKSSSLMVVSRSKS